MRQDLQGLLPKSQPIYVQNQNETIIDESFSEKKPEIRLIPYRKGDKWGFCDEKKNILITPKNDDAEDFSEGLASVKLNDKCGFTDKIGREIIHLKYDSYLFFEFKNGLVKIYLNDYRGYIGKDGTEFLKIKL